eukprot:SAG25_NODE_8072_length_441_cov_0.903509_2_plen_61_part_01
MLGKNYIQCHTYNTHVADGPSAARPSVLSPQSERGTPRGGIIPRHDHIQHLAQTADPAARP